MVSQKAGGGNFSVNRATYLSFPPKEAGFFFKKKKPKMEAAILHSDQ